MKPGASPLALLSQAADSTDRIAALIQAMTGQTEAKGETKAVDAK